MSVEQNPAYQELLTTGITCQGDVAIIWRSGPPPEDFGKVGEEQPLRVAHSESGHHHIASGVPGYTPPAGMLANMFKSKASLSVDESSSYAFLREGGSLTNERTTLIVNTVPVEVVHHRPYTTHETHVIPPVQARGEEGYWEIIRQEINLPGNKRVLNQD